MSACAVRRTHRRCARCGRSPGRCPRTCRPVARARLALGLGGSRRAGPAHRRRNRGTARRGRSRRPRPGRVPRRRSVLAPERPAAVRSIRRACSRSSQRGLAARAGSARAGRRAPAAACRAAASRAQGLAGVASGKRQVMRLRLHEAQAAAGAPADTRQHLVAAVGDEHGVLPLRRQAVVLGDDGPAVGQLADAGACRR